MITVSHSGMSSEKDLSSLLTDRLEAAKSLERLLGNPMFSSIQGVSKLRNRLASEIKFLDGVGL